MFIHERKSWDSILGNSVVLELYPVDKGTALLEIVATKYIVHIPNRHDPEEIKTNSRLANRRMDMLETDRRFSSVLHAQSILYNS
jgi:hypothetical protein